MQHVEYGFVTHDQDAAGTDVAGCRPASPAYRPPGDVICSRRHGMTIALRRRDHAAALRYEVAGRLDAAATREVREIEQAAAPHSIVEIDLGSCDGMDDYGFGSLIGLIRRAREQRAHVHVLDARPSIREGLHRSGVDRLVTLRTSLDDGHSDHRSGLPERRNEERR
jgi:anti-anti-sigma regulatory factor